MNSVLLSLAFFAGIAVFFTPCGIALLPSYVSTLIGEKEKKSISFSQRVRKGLIIGIIAGLGMVSVFLLFGIAISLFGNIFAKYAFWFGALTGVVLVVLGGMMLFGKAVSIKIPHSFTKRDGAFGIYLFGVGYALGGIGCTLPAFLFVVAAAFSGESVVNGITNFIAFSGGSMLMMLSISIIAVISKGAIQHFLSRYMSRIQKIASIIVILGGIYLIYFQMQAFYL